MPAALVPQPPTCRMLRLPSGDPPWSASPSLVHLPLRAPELCRSEWRAWRQPGQSKQAQRAPHTLCVSRRLGAACAASSEAREQRLLCAAELEGVRRGLQLGVVFKVGGVVGALDGRPALKAGSSGGAEAQAWPATRVALNKGDQSCGSSSHAVVARLGSQQALARARLACGQASCEAGCSPDGWHDLTRLERSKIEWPEPAAAVAAAGGAAWRVGLGRPVQKLEPVNKGWACPNPHPTWTPAPALPPQHHQVWLLMSFTPPTRQPYRFDRSTCGGRPAQAAMATRHAPSPPPATGYEGIRDSMASTGTCGTAPPAQPSPHPLPQRPPPPTTTTTCSSLRSRSRTLIEKCDGKTRLPCREGAAWG